MIECLEIPIQKEDLKRMRSDCGRGGSGPEIVRQTLKATRIGALGLIVVAALHAHAGDDDTQDYWQQVETETEAYIEELLPEGFSVVHTELNGPVFADADGMTLYTWPLKGLRNGDLGDRIGSASTCTERVFTTNSGLMSPYPEGLVLPDLDVRPSCVDLWPPVVAAESPEPIGKWTLIERTDGEPQWAYDGYPVYTSVLDIWPGDTYGGGKRNRQGDGPALRVSIGPAPDVPAEFQVVQTTTGRMLTNHTGFSIYVWDGDDLNESRCQSECLENWTPVLALEYVEERGDWTVFERSPGVSQWAYRGKPLYTYNFDPEARRMIGSDQAGWHNVFTQRVPAPPPEFTIQSTRTGHVLADADGRTIYIYNCGDDAPDQLFCDHPNYTQAYRLAVCGGNDPERCLMMFPPVEAPGEVETDNRLWGTVYIDPLTGKEMEPGEEGGMHVWTYRDRPVYTSALDKKPGDINADNWGEFNGWRNGYKAFWLRDDYYSNIY